MDLPRNLFGNLHLGDHPAGGHGRHPRPGYLFIVKPVLKTTDDAIIDQSTRSIQKPSALRGLDNIGKTIEGVNRQVQRQIRHPSKRPSESGTPASA